MPGGCPKRFLRPSGRRCRSNRSVVLVGIPKSKYMRCFLSSRRTEQETSSRASGSRREKAVRKVADSGLLRMSDVSAGLSKKMPPRFLSGFPAWLESVEACRERGVTSLGPSRPSAEFRIESIFLAFAARQTVSDKPLENQQKKKHNPNVGACGFLFEFLP